TCTLLAKDLCRYINQRVEIIGYLITTKNVTTSRGEPMRFGTFLDQEGMWIDTVHFPPSVKAFPFRGTGCYRLTGKVTKEFDFISLEVSEMYHLEVMNRMEE
ncbi:MAG TPA: DNA polymerase III subunit alpha, partial [Bacteroidia bacterium]